MRNSTSRGVVIICAKNMNPFAGPVVIPIWKSRITMKNTVVGSSSIAKYVIKVPARRSLQGMQSKVSENTEIPKPFRQRLQSFPVRLKYSQKVVSPVRLFWGMGNTGFMSLFAYPHLAINRGNSPFSRLAQNPTKTPEVYCT